jgi:6-pyruvoyltetrahydropterin/6-carboxytetrahydropterin synthase
MPIAYLTRIVEFTATHRFPPGPEFGAAAKDHSHRYQVHVTVKGSFAPERSGVLGLKTFDALLAREITARFDGQHINERIPEFADGRRLATGEALAVYIWERIAAALPSGVRLHAVRVQEGPHLYSEYFGEA